MQISEILKTLKNILKLNKLCDIIPTYRVTLSGNDGYPNAKIGGGL
jgi:hypothetical protein